MDWLEKIKKKFRMRTDLERALQDEGFQEFGEGEFESVEEIMNTIKQGVELNTHRGHGDSNNTHYLIVAGGDVAKDKPYTLYWRTPWIMENVRK